MVTTCPRVGSMSDVSLGQSDRGRDRRGSLRGCCVVVAAGMLLLGLVGCGSKHETTGLKLLKAQPIVYFTPRSATITGTYTQYYHRCDFAAFSQTCHDLIGWTLVPTPGKTWRNVGRDVVAYGESVGWTASDNTTDTLGNPLPVEIVKESSGGEMMLSCGLDTPPTQTHVVCLLRLPNQPSLN